MHLFIKIGHLFKHHQGGVVRNARTNGHSDPALKKHYIGQLVDALLLADAPAVMPDSEDPLWKVVETLDSEEDEKPYWAEVEGEWMRVILSGCVKCQVVTSRGYRCAHAVIGLFWKWKNNYI